jgi:hypothetical protein
VHSSCSYYVLVKMFVRLILKCFLICFVNWFNFYFFDIWGQGFKIHWKDLKGIKDANATSGEACRWAKSLFVVASNVFGSFTWLFDLLGFIFFFPSFCKTFLSYVLQTPSTRCALLVLTILIIQVEIISHDNYWGK